jgi:hypothetical protein
MRNFITKCLRSKCELYSQRNLTLLEDVCKAILVSVCGPLNTTHHRDKLTRRLIRRPRGNADAGLDEWQVARDGERHDALSRDNEPAQPSGARGNAARGWLSGRWGGVEIGPRKGSQLRIERKRSCRANDNGVVPGRKVRLVRPRGPDAKPTICIFMKLSVPCNISRCLEPP